MLLCKTVLAAGQNPSRHATSVFCKSNKIDIIRFTVSIHLPTDFSPGVRLAQTIPVNSKMLDQIFLQVGRIMLRQSRPTLPSIPLLKQHFLARSFRLGQQ